MNQRFPEFCVQPIEGARVAAAAARDESNPLGLPEGRELNPGTVIGEESECALPVLIKEGNTEKIGRIDRTHQQVCLRNNRCCLRRIATEKDVQMSARERAFKT